MVILIVIILFNYLIGLVFYHISYKKCQNDINKMLLSPFNFLSSIFVMLNTAIECIFLPDHIQFINLTKQDNVFYIFIAIVIIFNYLCVYVTRHCFEKKVKRNSQNIH